MLSFVGIAPHPPLVIPAVGRGELARVENTVQALKELSRRVKAAVPERLVVITPHGPILDRGIAVPAADLISGDFSSFGAPQVKLSFRLDQDLLRLLEEEVEKGGSLSPLVPVPQFRRLDHGAAVPLYYLEQEGVPLEGLHLTFGFLPYRDLFAFGQALRRAIERCRRPTAVIASADLSHRLIPGAPAGYTPRGAEFDRLLVRLLQEGKVEAILNLDPELVEEAGECGLRSIIIALGCAGERARAEVLSYEGPFGVGYLIAVLSTEAAREEEPPGGKIKPNPARLARQSLEHYLRHGKLLEPPEPLPPELARPCGAFVSIKSLDGELRGCIGTVEPTRRRAAEEIIANAVSAGLSDPRFPPVSSEELEHLKFSVDLLTPLERVRDFRELDPRRYGVLVRRGGRSGLLLPDLEGIDTVEQQISIARRKAGLGPEEPVDIYRFQVIRYHEREE